MSGVEAVGLVLAAIPLLVGKLSDYAVGIEKTKLMISKRRYRRELRMYESSLGVQGILLQDTITKLLEDVIGFDDEIGEMISDPNHSRWKDPMVERSLQTQLNRDYQAFRTAMSVVVALLEDLRKKLGLDKPESDPASESFMDDFKRFKRSFEFDVCKDLCDNLETANSLLGRLVDRAVERGKQSGKQRFRSKTFEKHRKLRKRSKGLHEALRGIDHSCCGCKAAHQVNLQLTMRAYESADPNEKFTMLWGIPKSAISDPTQSTSWIWHEVESATSKVQPSDPSVVMTGSSTSLTNRNTTVSFAQSTSSSLTFVQSAPDSVEKLQSFCDTLAQTPSYQGKCPLGYLEDPEEPEWRHDTCAVQRLGEDHYMHSLRDVLSTSSQAPAWLRDIPSARLPLQQRLTIAAKLAYANFQLHGNWLLDNWTTQDIVFAGQGIPDTPYVSWLMPVQISTDNLRASRPNHPLIASPTLFPLGVVLIQLALCRTLEELRQPSDENADKIVETLNTALRVLPVVEWECGKQYFQAVQTCLRWSGERDRGMDDEKFQRAAFDSVMTPLVECLDILSRD